MSFVAKDTNPGIEGYEEIIDVNMLNKDNVIDSVRRVRHFYDFIICSFHWGKDYSSLPTKEQVEFAREIIDNGCDLVYGHHTHTIQPFEFYGDGMILYGMGGLTFGDHFFRGELKSLYRKSKIGLVVRLDINDIKRSQFFLTKEYAGNVVRLKSRNYKDWSKRMWVLYKYKEQWKIVNFCFDFKESILDRIYEYFFGYYKNPIKRLFQIQNLKKFIRIISDFCSKG